MRDARFGTDLGLGVASYVVMTAIRGLVMFGAMPLLRRGHYGFGWRDALVITWGGLRGAVGLALAVAVYGDKALQDVPGMFGAETGARFQQVVLLHVSMTVGLTLLLNAPTSAPLLKSIGLTKLTDDRLSRLQLAQLALKRKRDSSLLSMSHHPIHKDVVWSSVQRLANFDQMCASILGQSYHFDESEAWNPAKEALSASGGGAHASQSHEALGLRRRRRDTHDESGSRSGTPNTTRAHDKQRAAGALDCARRRWHAIHTKLLVVNNLVGEKTFVLDFKRRLRRKRLREAKFRALELLKAHVWGMYKDGQVTPTAAQLLKHAIMHQVDELEAGRALDSPNPFPFEPLTRNLRMRPTMLRIAHAVGRIGNASVLFRPLTGRARKVVYAEFGRGYDVMVGYLLANEELLCAHDEGSKFSLDAEFDTELKATIKSNIKVRSANAPLRTPSRAFSRVLNLLHTGIGV